MRTRLVATPLAVASLAFAAAGCESPPPPARVPVPQTAQDAAVREVEPLRPLSPVARAQAAESLGEGPESRLPPPPFDDVPLVRQAAPEQPAYLAAYDRVGRPRLAVFVNRTIEGQLIPVSERRRVLGVERGRDGRIVESAEIYLGPGQYDAADAARIDYDAIETVLTDFLAANGRVTLVSPGLARTRLGDAEVQEIQAGRPRVLREVAEKLDADVLIQATAKPTRQTPDGLEVRVLVEAVNTRGGESIGRAFVDVPPPLTKQQLNRSARFLARKMMVEMSESWSQPAPDDAPRRREEPQQPPAVPPAPSAEQPAVPEPPTPATP